jgi:hypothetical protein
MRKIEIFFHGKVKPIVLTFDRALGNQILEETCGLLEEAEEIFHVQYS